MFEQKKLIVSHAPFWHIGNRVTERSYHTMLAALPAVLADAQMLLAEVRARGVRDLLWLGGAGVVIALIVNT